MLGKLSYARSLLITAPLIFIYTGIMGSLSVASSLFDSGGRIQHACARMWARMILWTARVRFRVRGVEHLQRARPYVLCVNHQSHMDIPIILAALPFQFRFAAKKVSPNVNRFGSLPCPRPTVLKHIANLRIIGRRRGPL